MSTFGVYSTSTNWNESRGGHRDGEGVGADDVRGKAESWVCSAWRREGFRRGGVPKGQMKSDSPVVRSDRQQTPAGTWEIPMR